MFEKVQILKAEGRNIRGIALEMGVNWRTARKWVHAPKKKPGPRPGFSLVRLLLSINIWRAPPQVQTS